MKSQYPIVALALSLGVLSCEGPPPTPARYFSPSSQGIQLQNEKGQKFALNPNDVVMVELESKGALFSSTIKLSSGQGEYRIKVPSKSFTSSTDFVLFTEILGKSSTIRGTRLVSLADRRPERGLHACNAGGDCGYSIPGSCSTDSNGYTNCTPDTWISAVCWGNEDALFDVQTFDESYRIEFGDSGHLLTGTRPRVEKTVSRILGPCIR